MNQSGTLTLRIPFDVGAFTQLNALFNQRSHRRYPGDGSVFQLENARSVDAAERDHRQFGPPRQPAKSL